MNGLSAGFVANTTRQKGMSAVDVWCVPAAAQPTSPALPEAGCPPPRLG